MSIASGSGGRPFSPPLFYLSLFFLTGPWIWKESIRVSGGEGIFLTINIRDGDWGNFLGSCLTLLYDDYFCSFPFGCAKAILDSATLSKRRSVSHRWTQWHLPVLKTPPLSETGLSNNKKEKEKKNWKSAKIQMNQSPETPSETLFDTSKLGPFTSLTLSFFFFLVAFRLCCIQSSFRIDFEIVEEEKRGGALIFSFLLFRSFFLKSFFGIRFLSCCLYSIETVFNPFGVRILSFPLKKTIYQSIHFK